LWNKKSRPFGAALWLVYEFFYNNFSVS